MKELKAFIVEINHPRLSPWISFEGDAYCRKYDGVPLSIIRPTALGHYIIASGCGAGLKDLNPVTLQVFADSIIARVFKAPFRLSDWRPDGLGCFIRVAETLTGEAVAASVSVVPGTEDWNAVVTDTKGKTEEINGAYQFGKYRFGSEQPDLTLASVVLRTDSWLANAGWSGRFYSPRFPFDNAAPYEYEDCGVIASPPAMDEE